MQIEMSGEVPPEVLQRMVMEQLGAETGGEATPPPPGGAAADPAAAAAAANADKEKQLQQKRLQRELEMLQRDVTLGRWHKLAAFFETLPEKSRKQSYEHFLRAVLQQCDAAPPMLNLISIGGQQRGVYGMPRCLGANHTLCDLMRELIFASAK